MVRQGRFFPISGLTTNPASLMSDDVGEAELIAQLEGREEVDSPFFSGAGATPTVTGNQVSVVGQRTGPPALVESGLAASLGEGETWTDQNPEQWLSLYRDIKASFNNITSPTLVEARVNAVAAAWPLRYATNRPPSAQELRSDPYLAAAMFSVAMGFHLLPPVFATNFPLASVSEMAFSGTLISSTNLRPPVATETVTSNRPLTGPGMTPSLPGPAPSGQGSTTYTPISTIPGFAQWTGQTPAAAAAQPNPYTPISNIPGFAEWTAPSGPPAAQSVQVGPSQAAYTNPETGQLSVAGAAPGTHYYLNGPEGPREIGWDFALMLSQAYATTPVGSVVFQPAIESWRGGFDNPDIPLRGYFDEWQNPNGSGDNSFEDWVNWLRAEGTITVPPGYVLDVPNQRLIFDPMLRELAQWSMVGSGAASPEIPLFSAADLATAVDLTALGPTTTGGGTSRSITFDREAVKLYFEEQWQAYLMADLAEDKAYSLADEYIEEATAFYMNRGGDLSSEAWILNRIRKAPRHALLYSYKPNGVSELDYLSGFQKAAGTVGVPERLQVGSITSSMSSGASAVGYGLRAARSPTVFAIDPNSFISRLTKTAAASIGRID